MNDIPVHVIVASCGLLLGVAFGYTVRRSDFCMMGAVADLALKGDANRLRAWLLAMAVAICASQALQLTGTLELSPVFYLSPAFPWLSLAAGGIAFGFGMVLACGCPSRSAVNAACGDLRALVTLIVVGLFAGMTLRGITAPPRVWLNDHSAIDLVEAGLSPSQGVVELIHSHVGAPEDILRLLVTILVSLGLLAWCLRSADFRAQKALWVAGIVLGLLVSTGWFVTGVLGADEFEPTTLGSLTFVRPVSDGILYLMTFTGSTIDFGVAVVAGVLAGSFLSGATSGSLKFRGFEDLYETRRYLTGGALMGVGGVLALGCTVGQGISGVSTLSAGSILAVICIVIGGVAGSRYLETGSIGGAIRAMWHV